jgi:hypothetical protein
VHFQKAESFEEVKSQINHPVEVSRGLIEKKKKTLQFNQDVIRIAIFDLFVSMIVSISIYFGLYI